MTGCTSCVSPAFRRRRGGRIAQPADAVAAFRARAPRPPAGALTKRACSRFSHGKNDAPQSSVHLLAHERVAERVPGSAEVSRAAAEGLGSYPVKNEAFAERTRHGREVLGVAR